MYIIVLNRGSQCIILSPGASTPLPQKVCVVSLQVLSLPSCFYSIPPQIQVRVWGRPLSSTHTHIVATASFRFPCSNYIHFISLVRSLWNCDVVYIRDGSTDFSCNANTRLVLSNQSLNRSRQPSMHHAPGMCRGSMYCNVRMFTV